MLFDRLLLVSPSFLPRLPRFPFFAPLRDILQICRVFLFWDWASASFCSLQKRCGPHPVDDASRSQHRTSRTPHISFVRAHYHVPCTTSACVAWWFLCKLIVGRFGNKFVVFLNFHWPWCWRYFIDCLSCPPASRLAWLVSAWSMCWLVSVWPICWLLSLSVCSVGCSVSGLFLCVFARCVLHSVDFWKFHYPQCRTKLAGSLAHFFLD